MNDCSYFYTFKTPYACPTTIGVFASVGTVISVFFSFILIALVVSFCSAVAYNRYFLKKSGLEQFPSVEVIRNGIEFVRDISVIIGIVSSTTLSCSRFKIFQRITDSALSISKFRQYSTSSRIYRQSLDSIEEVEVV